MHLGWVESLDLSRRAGASAEIVYSTRIGFTPRGTFGGTDLRLSLKRFFVEILPPPNCFLSNPRVTGTLPRTPTTRVHILSIRTLIEEIGNLVVLSKDRLHQNLPLTSES